MSDPLPVDEPPVTVELKALAAEVVAQLREQLARLVGDATAPRPAAATPSRRARRILPKSDRRRVVAYERPRCPCCGSVQLRKYKTARLTDPEVHTDDREAPSLHYVTCRQCDAGFKVRGE